MTDTIFHPWHDSTEFPDEEWQPIRLGLFRGRYFISSLGRLYSVRYKKLMKPQLTSQGYLRVGLVKDAKLKSYLVHRLVALTFLKRPKGKKTINHKNGVKGDNRVENLEWCTQSENNKHAFANGFNYPMRGEAQGLAKLTAADVIYARNKYAKGKKGRGCNALAKELGVSEANMRSILVYKTSWKWLDDSTSSTVNHPWHDSEEFPDLCSYCGLGKDRFNDHVWKRGNVVGNGRAPMEEALEKVDSQIGGAVRRLGEETPKKDSWEESMRETLVIYKTQFYGDESLGLDNVIDEIATEIERAREEGFIRGKLAVVELADGFKRDTCVENHAAPTKYCDSCSDVRAVNLILSAIVEEAKAIEDK